MNLMHLTERKKNKCDLVTITNQLSPLLCIQYDTTIKFSGSSCSFKYLF